jgi:hypothetical protein
MPLRVLLVLALLPASLAPLAAAQARGPQPTLVLSILAGYHGGHGLWEIPKQPYAVLGGSGMTDTLRLQRSIGSSLALGVAGTYFARPALGLVGELLYVSLPMENACDSLYINDTGPGSDPEINDQICGDVDRSLSSNSAFIVSAGVVLRGAPRGAISPYARGTVGWASYSTSTIEMSGAFVQGGTLYSRQVLGDPDPDRSSLAFRVGAGLTASLGPGYQFRLELADDIVSLTRVTGTANGLGIAPTAAKYYHHLLLTMGLDVVLERRRGRRY